MSRTKNARAPKAESVQSTNGRFALTEDHIGEPVKSSEIEYAPRKLSQKYVALMQKVLSLKPNQSLPIELPEGREMKSFRATIHSTLSKRTAGKLGKNRLKVRESADGRLVISLVPNAAE